MDRRQFIQGLTVVSVSGMVGCGKRRQTAFPELEAVGGPGDLGLAHGRRFASQISYNLGFYRQWLSFSGQFSTDRLLELARGFVTVLADQAPALLEEVEGIALGAGLKTEEVMLINARTDILAILDREVQQSRIPACTAMALWGEVGGRTTLALGQNWDWDPLMAQAPVVLRLNPTDGPRLIMLVEAGMVGKIGFNQHRLGVCLNFLSHVADGQVDHLGVPIHCLLRMVLGCDTIEGAKTSVEAAPRCASANFLLAQHGPTEPRALDLEIAPDDVQTLSPTNGRLLHTNHFLSPDLVAGCTSGRGPSTMKRMARAEELAARLATRISDPVERMQRILVSRQDLPYPISRDHNPDPSSSTLAGIIMDLSNNRLILTNGPPHRSRWITEPGVS
jgi:isopenicillin-N N-acyltransferase-like protein